MSDDHAERARSFGQIAEEYDRWRPDYPDALYDDVLRAADGGRILEAGAGTGRATVGLARRGASVRAVEPDPAMAAVARARTRGLPVDVHESAFEDCAPDVGAFDVVAAAQSWHWVDQERGPAVAARALRPGGALCLWWNRPRDLDGPVWAAVHDAYARHAPELDRRDAHRQHSDRERQFPTPPGFTPWTYSHYDWATTYDADGFTALMATQSNHVLLPPEQRTRLLDGIRAAIADNGGHLEYRYRTLLVTAHTH